MANGRRHGNRDTQFEPEHPEVRAIDLDPSAGGLHQGAQPPCCNSDAVHMAAADQMPEPNKALAPREPSTHDSQGARSDQIDMVIYDKHFTPTLLDQQSHHYIPAEAVYAVFEAKPHFDKDYLKYAGQKAASVRKLHRTSVSIAHAGGKFAPKEPFPILAGIVAARSSWTDGLGKSFLGNLPTSGDEALNCGCALEHGAFDDFDGGVNVTPRDGALVYFLFRLLSKLQVMGTVPAIDWAAYAQILNSTTRA